MRSWRYSAWLPLIVFSRHQLTRHKCFYSAFDWIRKKSARRSISVFRKVASYWWASHRRNHRRPRSSVRNLSRVISWGLHPTFEEIPFCPIIFSPIVKAYSYDLQSLFVKLLVVFYQHLSSLLLGSHSTKLQTSFPCHDGRVMT